MRSLVLLTSLITLPLLSPQVYARDPLIIRVRLPDADVMAGYVEGDPFTVRLYAQDVSVEGVSFYIGNSEIAIELRAHPSRGLVLQGQLVDPPYEFKKGSTVKVLPGYKRPADLPKGTVYVELPGVKFELPEDKERGPSAT